MQIRLYCVGRARRGTEHELYRQFAERLAWPVELKEVEERRPGSPRERVRREADLFKTALRAAKVRNRMAVALDAAGKALTSEAFADALQT